jgi:hypothetical protein
MSDVAVHPGALPPPTKRAYFGMAADLQRVFGSRFVGLAAYGQSASVGFVDTLAADDLQAMRSLVETWHREGLATPLVMTVDEFNRSLDAFPLEYQAMIDTHVVIAGQMPFAAVQIDPEDLRRACEAQARSHLIHLRQGWLESGSHESQLADLVVRSAAPFHALLTNVSRLSGAPHATVDDLNRFAEQTIGMPVGIARDVLDLNVHPEHGRQVRARLGEYLAAAERLWNFIDTWRAR